MRRSFSALRGVMLGLSLWVCCLGEAQAQRLSASVDKTVGSLEDQFVFTVVATAKPDEDPVDLQVPGMEVHSAGTSSNMSWVNGDFSREISYRFVLLPKQVGTFTIPAVTLRFDGKEESTIPIKLKIRDGAARSTDVANKGESPLFIERTIKHTQPFVGQPIVSVVKVFQRVHMLEANVDPGQVSTLKRLSFEGEKSYEQVVDGISYRVTELRSVLVPLKPGKVSLPPYRLKAKVRAPEKPSRRQRGRDVFDQFFNDSFFGQGRVVVKQAVSEGVELQIKDLPEQGRPKDFSGIVGDFQVSASLSADRLEAGDTATLTVVLSGRGPLDGVDTLPIPELAELKVYEDQAESGQRLDEELGIVSRKTFKYALVPTAGGDLELGDLDIPIFDPYAGSYRRLKAQLGTLKVSGAKAGAAIGAVGSLPQRQRSVEVTDEDLIGNHRGAKLWADHRWRAGDSFWSLGLLLLSFGIWCVSLARYWLASRSGMGSEKRRSQAQKVFAASRSQWGQGSSTGAVQAAAEAWRTYLGDRWNRFGGALTPKDIQQQLESMGASSSLVTEALEVSQWFDRRTYGGGHPEDGEWTDMVAKLDRLVEQIGGLS